MKLLRTRENDAWLHVTKSGGSHSDNVNESYGSN